MVGRRARYALPFLAIVALCCGCGGDTGQMTTWIGSLIGGRAYGPGGYVLFQPNTFNGDAWVTLYETDLNDYSNTPDGAPVGVIEFDIQGNSTMILPASASFTIPEGTQTAGGLLNVYEARGVNYTLVGQAEVAANGKTAWLDSAIDGAGTFVIGPAPAI